MNVQVICIDEEDHMSLSRHSFGIVKTKDLKHQTLAYGFSFTPAVALFNVHNTDEGTASVGKQRTQRVANCLRTHVP